MIPDYFLSRCVLDYTGGSHRTANKRYFVCCSCGAAFCYGSINDNHPGEQAAATAFKARIRHKDGCRAYGLWKHEQGFVTMQKVAERR
jgi:hypothetical protein